MIDSIESLKQRRTEMLEEIVSLGDMRRGKRRGILPSLREVALRL
jgi:hypothetical protein